LLRRNKNKIFSIQINSSEKAIQLDHDQSVKEVGEDQIGSEKRPK
jgi:hypothetical protein